MNVVSELSVNPAAGWCTGISGLSLLTTINFAPVTTRKSSSLTKSDIVIDSDKGITKSNTLCEPFGIRENSCQGAMRPPFPDHKSNLMK